MQVKISLFPLLWKGWTSILITGVSFPLTQQSGQLRGFSYYTVTSLPQHEPNVGLQAVKFYTLRSEESHLTVF